MHFVYKSEYNSCYTYIVEELCDSLALENISLVGRNPQKMFSNMDDILDYAYNLGLPKPVYYDFNSEEIVLGWSLSFSDMDIAFRLDSSAMKFRCCFASADHNERRLNKVMSTNRIKQLMAQCFEIDNNFIVE